MEKENIPEEVIFLKGIFPAKGWEIYNRRLDLLSSLNSKDWDFIDFPLEVSVELTNFCNLACIMCPVPNLKRSRGFMDGSIFMKVVNEVSKEDGFIFLPQGFGESLLHDEWDKMMGIAAKEGIRPLVILTNGNLFNDDIIRVLVDYADAVIVTIDGATAKTYESIRRKGNFEKITGNIMHFIDIRGRWEFPRLVIRIIRMKETEGEIELFRAMWKERLKGTDLIQVAEFNDWAERVNYRGVNKREDRLRHPCRMLWKNLTIYHNGDVSPCCYDAEGEMIVGNVLRNTLKEIWKGEALKSFRMYHLNGDFESLPLCSRCKGWI